MKKICSAVLALLMLLGTLSLAACKKDEAPPAVDGGSDVAPSTDGQDTTADTAVEDKSDVLEVEKADHNQKMITVLQRTATKGEMYTEKYGGDLIADTVFDRNHYVEAYLNVKLNFVDETGTNHTFSTYKTKITNSLASGNEEFHIVANYAYFGASMAAEGSFTDYNTIPEELNHIDTSKVWWNQSYVDQATINNRLYFLEGDITTTAIDRLEVMFYNETMTEEYFAGVDFLQLVYDYQWTYEYFLDCLKVTGDGSTNGGIWGASMPQNSNSIDGFLAGLAVDIVTRNSRGGVEINFNTDRTQSIAEALRDLYHNNAAVNNSGPETAFETGTSMFYLGLMSRARTNFRNVSFDYGMLPMPLWNEDQNEYRVTPHDEYSILGIPSNVTESMEAVTAVLEVMAAESYKSLRPTILEESYKNRDLVTGPKGRMFDFIIDNAYFDFGYIYSHSIGNPVHILRNYVYYENPSDSLYVSSLPEALTSGSATSETQLRTFTEKFYE